MYGVQSFASCGPSEKHNAHDSFLCVLDVLTIVSWGHIDLDTHLLDAHLLDTILRPPLPPVSHPTTHAPPSHAAKDGSFNYLVKESAEQSSVLNIG